MLHGGASPVGNGHLTWVNGTLFVVTIGTGELFAIKGKNSYEKICGISMSFGNTDGTGAMASFSKPNGIAGSLTGGTLLINCSDPSWIEDPFKLHPALLRMVTGLCQVNGIKCWTEGEREAIDQIKSNTEFFSKAYQEKQYDKMVDSCTVDGKILPNGSKIISGHEAIRQRWILPENQKVTRHKVFHEEIKILGDEAYDYGYYEENTEFAYGRREVGKENMSLFGKKWINNGRSL